MHLHRKRQAPAPIFSINLGFDGTYSTLEIAVLNLIRVVLVLELLEE